MWTKLLLLFLARVFARAGLLEALLRALVTFRERQGTELGSWVYQ